MLVKFDLKERIVVLVDEMHAKIDLQARMPQALGMRYVLLVIWVLMHLKLGAVLV